MCLSEWISASFSWGCFRQPSRVAARLFKSRCPVPPPHPKMPAIMFPSSSSDLVHAIDCDLKQSPGHLFVRQPHTIQIIQLVEGPPPPPRPIESVIQTSSAGSSSASSCPTSSDEDCSSYCSSVITPDHSAPVQWTDDTYSTRMKRVHAWRDGFVKATSTCPVSGACASPAALCPLSDAPPEPRAPSLKRKTHPPQTEDDSVRFCVRVLRKLISARRSRTPPNVRARG